MPNDCQSGDMLAFFGFSQECNRWTTSELIFLEPGIPSVGRSILARRANARAFQVSFLEPKICPKTVDRLDKTKHRTVRDLFPELPEEQLREVEEVLHDYGAIVWRICERLTREQAELVDGPYKHS